MMNTKEGLKIAQKIKQRRLQMLVHSRLYYEMDKNIVSDATWAKWAKELQQLQEQYPDIAKSVIYADAFEGWDGSSGAFLPLTDEWVVNKANYLWFVHENPVKPKPEPKKEKSKQLRLF